MRLFNQIVALESRFFDSISAGASVELDESQLDLGVLRELERHDDLIKALDAWVMAPDRRLYPQLIELAAVVLRVCRLPAHLEIYRGFDPQSPYQNTMGLSERGFLSNREKSYRKGEKHAYASDDAPLSFSTDASIARAFGKVVVRAQIDPRCTCALVIVPELAALVSKRRQIEPATQHEVILLPPLQVEFVIEEIR